MPIRGKSSSSRAHGSHAVLPATSVVCSMRRGVCNGERGESAGAGKREGREKHRRRRGVLSAKTGIQKLYRGIGSNLVEENESLGRLSERMRTTSFI